MSEELTQQLPNEILREILARLDSMDSRLTGLEEKVDRRLQETRPIWEGVLEQLKGMNARLDSIEKEGSAMRRWFRQTFIEVARDQDRLEERVENIEAQIATRETPAT